jgi:hypothetical protein
MNEPAPSWLARGSGLAVRLPGIEQISATLSGIGPILRRRSPRGRLGQYSEGPGTVQQIGQPTFGQGIVVSLGVALVTGALAIAVVGGSDGEGVPALDQTNVVWWLCAIVVVVVAGAGAQYAERSAATAAAAVGHPRPKSALATAWAVPSVATFAAVLLVATYHNGWMMAFGPLIAFFGTAGALLSRDLLDDAADTTHRVATTVHTVVIHVVAFLALGAIAYNKLPLWVGLPLTWAVAGALALEALERGALEPVRRVGYALLGGFAVAEALIAVSWWPTHGWTGGAVLLVCFYLAAGVLVARAQRPAFRSRDLWEFGAVGLVAFTILAATA